MAVPAVSLAGKSCKRQLSPLASEGTACLLAKRQRSLLEAFSGMPRDEGRGNYGDLQGELDSGEKSATKAGAFSGMLLSYDRGGGHSHSGPYY